MNRFIEVYCWRKKGFISIMLAMLALPLETGADTVGPIDGTVQITLDQNTISASASHVPLRRVLAALSEILELRLYCDNETFLDWPVSLDMEDVSLTMAMDNILTGLHYAVDYGGFSRDQHGNTVPGILSIYVISDQENDASKEPTILVTDSQRPTPVVSHDNPALSIIDSLYYEGPDQRLRTLQSIVEQSSFEQIDLVYPFLNDPSAGVREAALAAISQHAGPQVAHSLQQLTVDQVDGVRETVMELAYEMDSQATEPVLIAGLKENDRYIWQRTIESLATRGGPVAEKALVDSWNRGDTQQRKSILMALPEMPGAIPEQLVSIALSDDSSEVRRQAIHVIADMDNPDLFPLLEYSLGDDSPAVRRTAREVMAELSQ